MAAEYTSDYTKFDAEYYLKLDRESRRDPVCRKVKTKKMQWFHEAFATNQIKGRRLLDIGTGPCFNSVISASSHVDSIFLSDFAPQCREILKTWLDGDLQHSFDEDFKCVVELEGKGESPSDREISLQRKISGICHIDVRQEYPLAPSYFPKFDIITTSLCFVNAAKNHESYERMAGRVADMLQIGGHLVLFSMNGPKFYKVANDMFTCLEIDGEKVRKTWKNCGFEIIEWKQETQESLPIAGEAYSAMYYLLIAKKVKSL